MHRSCRRALYSLLVAAMAAPVATCATNPATGERQLMLVGQEGMRSTSGVGTTRIHGLPATTGVFVASTDRGDVQGRASFLEYGGRVY